MTRTINPSGCSDALVHEVATAHLGSVRHGHRRRRPRHVCHVYSAEPRLSAADMHHRLICPGRSKPASWLSSLSWLQCGHMFRRRRAVRPVIMSAQQPASLNTVVNTKPHFVIDFLSPPHAPQQTLCCFDLRNSEVLSPPPRHRDATSASQRKPDHMGTPDLSDEDANGRFVARPS